MVLSDEDFLPALTNIFKQVMQKPILYEDLEKIKNSYERVSSELKKRIEARLQKNGGTKKYSKTRKMLLR
jgi:hypothetical protein